jgi:hypothetical protein
MVDEDPAMKIVISKVFLKMHQQYCRFHVTHTWRYESDRLYICKKWLKVELESLINFPLDPSKFEKAWNKLVERYGIKEHPAIVIV